MGDSDPQSAEIQPPEITADQIIDIPDPHFTEDSVAIVTGSASGIGRATALVLGANGLNTLATDIDGEGLQETRSKATELGISDRIHTHIADLRDDMDLSAVVETATEIGQIRFLANIAGMQTVAPIDDFPMAAYERMHQVMLRAPLMLSKLVLPHLRAVESGTGAIGNMASVHSHYVTKDKVAYNTLKFGLRGLTNSIAAESAGSVRAFSISTGYVKTPLVLNQIADSAESRGISEREVVEEVMLGQARIKKLMDPVEVANLFTFGFSKHARHLNGADLLWDGGYVNTYE